MPKNNVPLREDFTHIRYRFYPPDWEFHPKIVFFFTLEQLSCHTGMPIYKILIKTSLK